MGEVEHLLSVQNRLGEGPRWNVEEHALYWVDIEGEAFHRYHPGTGKVETFHVGVPVGVLGFRGSGGLVMATGDGLAFWSFPSGPLQPIAEPERGKPDSRFNDGGTDRRGRFWAGTMSPDATSSLYRLDADLSLHTMVRGLTISNGVGWSPDNKTMYLTDSTPGVIYAYDFDLATGAIENRRRFVQLPGGRGVPDGLTVDGQGFVWSATWGGSRVVRYDPEGKQEREIRLPVTNVSCCAFGGDDLTDLYITTAWSGLSQMERSAQPLAGDVFRVRTEVKGMPEPLFLG